MNNSVIIGFYGLSNTGKTTLVTRLIKKLTEKKYNVASIKQTTHSYSIDSPGKDTWKHARAGSDLVCFQTMVETSFIIKQELSFGKIKEIISCIDDYDVILVEGARDEHIQKIRLDEKTPVRDNTAFTFDGDINKVISFIEKNVEGMRTMAKKVELVINGKRVPLSEFPEEFIKNTLFGMMTTLKGVDEDIETMTLSISQK